MLWYVPVQTFVLTAAMVWGYRRERTRWNAVLVGMESTLLLLSVPFFWIPSRDPRMFVGFALLSVGLVPLLLMRIDVHRPQAIWQKLHAGLAGLFSLLFLIMAGIWLKFYFLSASLPSLSNEQRPHQEPSLPKVQIAEPNE